jgi:CheY-like chemotaxis protein
MVGMMRGQVNESRGVGGCSRGWLALYRHYAQNPSMSEIAWFRQLSFLRIRAGQEILSLLLVASRCRFGSVTYSASASVVCWGSINLVAPPSTLSNDHDTNVGSVTVDDQRKCTQRNTVGHLDLPSRQFKILAVDDSPIYRKLVEQSLSQERYTLLFAKNGREALDLFAKHHPAVVVTDWAMPDIEGLELCRRIRHDFQGVYAHLILLPF